MSADFPGASRLIERAIESRAFPAAAIEVGRRQGPLWRHAFGHLTYAADAPAASTDTLFDLASLTKVIATATLVMRAVDAGTLALDDRVADRLPAWRGDDRAHVTIADLLEHASGLTAYLPFFRDHHGRAEFERAICTLPLEYAPRTQSIYSDLGFMLLAFILEDVNHAPLATQFDGIFREQRFRLKAETTEIQREAPGIAREPSGPTSKSREPGGATSKSGSFRLLDHRSLGGGGQAEDLLFNPPRELRARCAPTELDLWRGRLLQGEVHDENTWELGGAAGHAGLFGTAAAVGAFARRVLDDLMLEAGSWKPEAGDWKPAAGNRKLETGSRKPEAGDWKPAAGNRKLEAGSWKLKTLARFVRKSAVPGSSRALGWDTMLPTSSCGTRLSPRAIGHTGFTGTSLWIDPAQDLYVVFLTNRVHPTRDNNQIQRVRRALHDTLVASLQES